MSVAESGFARFMATAAGRIRRVIAGLAIIWWGYTLRARTAGLVLMSAGLVPLLAGAFDVCLRTGLFGGPFGGAAIRRSTKRA
jgi:hypothetical protein